MQEYFWGIIIIGIFEGLDIASVAARVEMYNELRYLTNDKRNEIPTGLYSSICFYLIPGEKLIKMTKKFPLTYLFDRKIKSVLKNKTYDGEYVLERLDRIKNLKWEDIKDKKIIINIDRKEVNENERKR